MNIVERARDKWNKQADEFNQWLDLGTDEKLELIIAEESSDRALLEEAVRIIDKLLLNGGIARDIHSLAYNFLTRAKERGIKG